MERLICIAMGYVFGLFQTSYIYGRLHQMDIREHGSGNAGTTNALRTLGKKAGAVTLLGDCLKCVLAVLAARVFYGNSHQEIMPLLGLYAAAGCILGHNFPFYMKFKGGKGVAASVGMILAVDWRVFLICAVVFFTLFFTTHYVSLCSISAYVTAFIGVAVSGALGRYGMDVGHQVEMDVVFFLLTVLAVARHHENIRRLRAGQESRLFLSKVGKDDGKAAKQEEKAGEAGEGEPERNQKGMR